MKTIFKVIKNNIETFGTDADMFDYQKHPKNYEIVERGFRVDGAVYWSLIIKAIIANSLY